MTDSIFGQKHLHVLKNIICMCSRISHYSTFLQNVFLQVVVENIIEFEIEVQISTPHINIYVYL